MSAHGLVLSAAAGFAALYLGWTVGARNGDGQLVGWVLGTLVFAGGVLWDLGV